MTLTTGRPRRVASGAVSVGTALIMAAGSGPRPIGHRRMPIFGTLAEGVELESNILPVIHRSPPYLTVLAEGVSAL